MEKTSTTYFKILESEPSRGICLTINEEFKDYVSLHEYGEPCTGILKHWGTRESLIKELEEYISILKESKNL